MRFLLDTNVISELAKEEPNQRVTDWFSKVESDSLYISVITLGEIRKGVDLMPPSKKRERFARWLEWDLPVQFEGRILPLDQQTMDLWGRIAAKAKRPLPAIDALMAATALAHKLKMVTRNVKDFEYPGLNVINPWS